MIYKVTISDDFLVQEAYKEGMDELNDFWGINWKINTPDISIVSSRKEINQIMGKETSQELVGWSKNRNVFVLDYQKVETESSYRLTPEQYKALIKHEMNHIFEGIVSNGSMGPFWLKEGLSIYLSGQISLGQWERPSEFKGFINSDENNKKAAYEEGGYVVELLVNKFGKGKIIELIKLLKTMKSDEDFLITFKQIFGLDLNYENINRLYLS
ncbi:MAG TPA: hypothetical protein VF837_03975 [Patescibacteria group bacterium]